MFEEVKVFPMAVKPADLRYDYGSRAAVTQTIPDHGFVDRFGSRLTRVVMSGTFGLQPRRQGISVKDGVTRFLEFRDEIFKVSQQARAVSEDGKEGFVYALNYYDFIWDERFAVNLETFRANINARRNPFEPIYELTFTSIGPTISAVPGDTILGALLAADRISSTASSAPRIGSPGTAIIIGPMLVKLSS